MPKCEHCNNTVTVNRTNHNKKVDTILKAYFSVENAFKQFHELSNHQLGVLQSLEKEIKNLKV